MIELIDGKGQLGEALKEHALKFSYSQKDKIKIYHTWDIENKGHIAQEKEYLKFKDFVDNNRNYKIVL